MHRYAFALRFAPQTYICAHSLVSDEKRFVHSAASRPRARGVCAAFRTLSISKFKKLRNKFKRDVEFFLFSVEFCEVPASNLFRNREGIFCSLFSVSAFLFVLCDDFLPVCRLSGLTFHC